MTSLPTTSKNLLPAIAMRMTDLGADLRAAGTQIGSGGGGGGETYLKIHNKTGEITFGSSQTPLPEDRRRFVVPVPLFLYGYTIQKDGKPIERHLVSMASDPRMPTPPGGKYTKYPDDGPRKTVEITLSSLDEPGFNLVFTSWSISHENRLSNLWENIASQKDGKAGKAGFLHPVILLKSSCYKNDFGTTFHFDYEILDWLHNDGNTFLSKVDLVTFKGPLPDSAGSLGDGEGDDDDTPWDDGDDDDEDEEMTGQERELLKDDAAF